MARQNDTLENCLYKLHVYIYVVYIPKRCANNMIKVLYL